MVAYTLQFPSVITLASLDKREEERCCGDSEKIKHKVINTYRPYTLVLGNIKAKDVKQKAINRKCHEIEKYI